MIFHIEENNKKYGVVDEHGKIAIDFIYDDISRFESNHYQVWQNGNFGILSQSLHTIIPVGYREIKVEGKFFIVWSDIYYADVMYSVKGLIDFDGKRILDTNFRSIKVFEKCIVACSQAFDCESKLRYNLFDLNGNKISNDYDQMYEINTNVYYAKKKNDVGLVNERNNVLIPLKYWDLFRLDNLYLATESGSTTIFNSDFSFSRNLNLFASEPIGTHCFVFYKGGKYGVFNLGKDEVVLENEFDEFKVVNKSFAVVTKNNFKALYSARKSSILSFFIYSEIEPTHNNFFWCKILNKWGLINHQGELCIHFYYDFVRPEQSSTSSYIIFGQKINNSSAFKHGYFNLITKKHVGPIYDFLKENDKNELVAKNRDREYLIDINDKVTELFDYI